MIGTVARLLGLHTGFIWAGLGVAALVAGYFVYHAIRDQGAREVIEKIEEENNEVIEDADLSELGFDDCIRAGGLWDFAGAKCKRP